MTRKNRKRKEIKRINETWFKNHTTNVKDYGEITVISFREKESCYYYMNIVLQGWKVYITGDLGEAIFILTEEANVHKIANYDLGYFLEKLKCFNGDEYNFDVKLAKRDLKELCIECMRDDYASRHDIKDRYNTFVNALERCENLTQWQNYLYNETDMNWDDLNYFSDIGRELNCRLIAYHEAFKIISKQIKIKNKSIKQVESAILQYV